MFDSQVLYAVTVSDIFLILGNGTYIITDTYSDIRRKNAKTPSLR